MAKAKLPVSRAKTAYGLLSDVCKLIIEEPLRYNQCDWIRRIGEDGPGVLPAKKFPSCGTVGCVAGWVATLKRPDAVYSRSVVEAAATSVLGLSFDQSCDLFSGAAAGGGGQSRQHARLGVKHIRTFQKKYRHQLLAKKV